MRLTSHSLHSASFAHWINSLNGGGKPDRLRCDNGLEFISQALEKWADKHGIQVEFIQSGNPQQNVCVERYNRTVRYSWLSQYLFDSIREVQDYATQ